MNGGVAMNGGVPECHDEVCMTCSDTAVPVTVIQLLDDDLALVRTDRGQEEVSVALVQARVGDTILVHASEAIAVLGGGPA
jgi:hydrogenase expression/formation protein HypC